MDSANSINTLIIVIENSWKFYVNLKQMQFPYQWNIRVLLYISSHLKLNYKTNPI